MIRKTLLLATFVTGLAAQGNAQLIRTFTGHGDEVNSVSSGRWHCAVVAGDFSVTSVSFSPDGKFALSGSWDETLKLWDVATGREIRTFSGHGDGVTSVSFSPDGKFALSGSWDKTLKLWEVATGKEIRTFSGHGY